MSISHPSLGKREVEFRPIYQCSPSMQLLKFYIAAIMPTLISIPSDNPLFVQVIIQYSVKKAQRPRLTQTLNS